MYIPSYSRHDDRGELLELMRAHPFGTLVTAPEGRPFATHLPLMLGEGPEGLALTSHMARANPQWRHFTETPEVLAVFQGPHALVHSNLYNSAPNVPTWNYAVVHAYGPAHVVTGAREREIAYRLVEAHTPDMTPIPEDFERRLLAAVVTFELRVTRLEGKFKLSQNKTDGDRRNVIEALERSERETERDLAALMARQES